MCLFSSAVVSFSTFSALILFFLFPLAFVSNSRPPARRSATLTVRLLCMPSPSKRECTTELIGWRVRRKKKGPDV